ncbi:uncharacterized protein LOC127096502 [Lathyrus oleraceus]|uniref:uncharacterized protein LOC127096502 n=1 Tax=Pisum sativum TaxID=3888 RepID=UPI0021CFE89E|nr:uncharacterized protein LOC127096502 [Pisum sativum]
MGSERRNTLPLKFKLPIVDTLITLRNKVTPCNKNNFICRYGRILDLITTPIEVSTLVALSQYYDPPLRCFTFQDFQLALTIKEYERLLDWYVKDHPPFTKLDEPLLPESVAEALHLPIEKVSLGLGPRGFTIKFLEEKAWALEKEGKWLPFSAILSLLVYGVVLFPNDDDYINQSIISVFVSGNSVPALKGPWVDFLKDLRWSQKFASLTTEALVWYLPASNVEQVIMSCGDFSNVPLMGPRGCINYDPSVALRQLGYPMENEPRVELLKRLHLAGGGNRETRSVVEGEESLDPDSSQGKRARQT